MARDPIDDAWDRGPEGAPDKAKPITPAWIDPTTLDTSETSKRYAVEILYPNGTWVVIGTVNVEPGQAVQVTVRVREMVG